MLTEVQNAMLEVLDTIIAFRERGVWQGNLEDLIKQPQKTPSAHVVLASGQFARPRVMGDRSPLLAMGWDVIIIYQCLKDRRVAADQGYGLIEAVVKPVSKDGVAVGGLTGLKTQEGTLWPVSLDLLNTVGGISAYAIRFDIERSIQ
jgi:hypothetical protein